MKVTLIEKIRKVYQEFGLDIHSIPPELQGKINRLALALIQSRHEKAIK